MNFNVCSIFFFSFLKLNSLSLSRWFRVHRQHLMIQYHWTVKSEFYFVSQAHDVVLHKMWIPDHNDSSDGEEKAQRGEVHIRVDKVIQALMFSGKRGEYSCPCFWNLSDNREETQRQNQQQPVWAEEARSYCVWETGEKTPAQFQCVLRIKEKTP